MKMGEKLLDMPDNEYLSIITLKNFGIAYSALDSDKRIMQNARRLVEMNNEVYPKLHPSCEDAEKIDGKCGGYATSIHDDEPADMCKECIKFVLYEDEAELSIIEDKEG